MRSFHVTHMSDSCKLSKPKLMLRFDKVEALRTWADPNRWRRLSSVQIVQWRRNSSGLIACLLLNCQRWIQFWKTTPHHQIFLMRNESLPQVLRTLWENSYLPYFNSYHEQFRWKNATIWKKQPWATQMGLFVTLCLLEISNIAYAISHMHRYRKSYFRFREHTQNLWMHYQEKEI